MSEEKPKIDRVRVTVIANAAHPDVLSVQDAMRQVLDFFDLLTPEGDETPFIWNLKLASANSPLTVEGEPYSAEPDIDVRAASYAQRRMVEESFRDLTEGRPLRRRITAKRRQSLKSIFRRNMNGIGKTELVLSDEPVYVTPVKAEAAAKALEQEESADFNSLFLRDRSRSEVGSLEGSLVDVGSDYHTPAVLIRERHTGQEVWCRVSTDIRDKISSQTTLNDVWAKARVTVRGRIRYNQDGSIARVWNADLRLTKPKVVEVGDIADPDFTSGNSISSYLERLREGEMG